MSLLFWEFLPAGSQLRDLFRQLYGLIFVSPDKRVSLPQILFKPSCGELVHFKPQGSQRVHSIPRRSAEVSLLWLMSPPAVSLHGPIAQVLVILTGWPVWRDAPGYGCDPFYTGFGTPLVQGFKFKITDTNQINTVCITLKLATQVMYGILLCWSYSMRKTRYELDNEIQTSVEVGL